VSNPGESRVLRVFISSASGALAPYRQAAVDVCHRLGFTPVHMEEFDAQRPPPLDVCRQQVESSDVFVLLLAHRYGSRPPGQALSYTELEYNWAVAKPQLALLPFVVDPAFPWPPPDIDRSADADALKHLTARVRASHLVKGFAGVEGFREDLIVALKRHETERPAEPIRTGGDSEGDEARLIPQPPVRPAFHAVPAYVGSARFTGRAVHLAALDEWAGSSDPVMVVEAIGGTGKSALTWQWVQDRSPTAINGLTGRMWWSFYDGSPSMTRFLREVLAYTTGRPMKEIGQLGRAELADEVIAELRQRPYLLVLDGLERLLSAYHRFDPSKLRDEEVEADQRSLIDPHAEDVIRRLAATGPSKILISSRLMPTALEGQFGLRLPGVRHLRLPGLSNGDTRVLLARVGVYGSQQAISGFFSPLGNHPLLIGMVAGLVNDYRAEPGGFDSWLADPAGGKTFTVKDADLIQRRTHILAAALDGLQPGPRRLLGWISVLAGSVSWSTLDAINPFLHDPPRPSPRRLLGRISVSWSTLDAINPFRADQEREAGQERTTQTALQARAQLDAALTELENRGLLWWDRSANCYDLHPIIRSYAHEQLEEPDRVQANDRVRDHFEALPPDQFERVTSVEDLTQTITIFRALIGAGHQDQASKLWAKFGKVLLVDLGAYATVTEMLTPLRLVGGVRVRGDLAIAWQLMGQYEKAISQEADILSERIHRSDLKGACTSLNALSAYFADSSAYVAATRYDDLHAALLSAAGHDASAVLYLARAARAIKQGRIEDAERPLTRAQSLCSANDPWLDEMVEIWRLYLALEANQTLTRDQLAKSADRVHSQRGRRDLAMLRLRLCINQQRFPEALSAAHDHEQLGRNAGLEVAPAASAFLLAKLGRPSEAGVVLEDALARLPRIHPAQRPHEYLARALHEMGRSSEAASHARAAYQQSWADGPPNCDYWRLRDARKMLEETGDLVPELRVVEPAAVTVPLEAEIREYIASVEANAV